MLLNFLCLNLFSGMYKTGCKQCYQSSMAFKMMHNVYSQSAVAAAVWDCACLYLQHGAWRVRCCRVGGHLLHLIPGTVRVLPKNHMVIARAGGQGNKTVT